MKSRQQELIELTKKVLPDFAPKLKKMLKEIDKELEKPDFHKEET